MKCQGSELKVGDTVLDCFGYPHLIERIREYPARFYGLGDHARVAYGDHWVHTIADRELFDIAA